MRRKGKRSFSRVFIFAAMLVATQLLGPGCGKPPASTPDVLFVRDGLAVQDATLIDCKIMGPDGEAASFKIAQSTAFRTDGGDVVLPFAWQPGREYCIKGTTRWGGFSMVLNAPLKAAPLTVAQIALESIKEYQGRGSNPDTYIRFSPDEQFVAIGSFFGSLRVVDIHSGRTVLKKRLAEGMVKRICWRKSKRGWTLLAGEQSPDSFVYAIDLATEEILWKYRLADDIGTSRPDSGDARMDIYNLPGPYFMQSLSGGDLIVIGLHGRYRGQNYVYDALVLRLNGETGEPRWKWPADRNLPYSVTWAGASADGSVVALLTDSWLGVSNPHPRFKNGALHCVDGKKGKAAWEYVVPPLAPYYDRASGWQGVAVSTNGRYVALGLNDGRGMLFDARSGSLESRGKAPLWVRNVGTPVMNGNIPVASSIAYAGLAGGSVFFGLPGTTIPPNTASSDRISRPAPHPRSHSLCAFDLSGTPQWEWQSEASVQGIFSSPDGRWVATGLTDDRGRASMDGFGMALFDTTLAERGIDPLVYRYYTEGSVFFMGDVSASGRYIAIAEYPYSPDEGRTMQGEYQVHVVH